MDLSFLHNVLTESGVHPASYAVDTGCVFAEIKRRGVEGLKLTTDLYLMPRLRMVELYLHSNMAW
jgi:hypothetical protein